MIVTATKEQISNIGSYTACILDDDPVVLSGIYGTEVNLAIWDRRLPADIVAAASKFVERYPGYRLSKVVPSANASESLREEFKGDHQLDVLINDICQLIEMFGLLFDLDFIGVRLSVLDRAMCPRFHVDHVPCRLITTYFGNGTEWLENNPHNRSLLKANVTKQTCQKSVQEQETNSRHIPTGNVALMKGENWEGNENKGLIHRSPEVNPSEQRLILTLDFHK